MQRYKYRARDAQGKLIVGEVEARDEKQATQLIRQKGYIVIGLSKGSGFSLSGMFSFVGRVSKNELTNFTRQLSTMIASGLPITESLIILRSQAKGGLEQIIPDILAEVEEGQSLSSAMSKYPKVFPNTYIALIKSGETGGVLDEVMVKLAENMEKQQEFSGKIKGAMIYPIILVVGMVAVAFIMMVFVLPRITVLYDQFGSDLPIATKILVGVSNFAVKFWYLVMVLLGIIFYFFRGYKASPIGRKKMDQLMLDIPLLGPLKRQVIMTDLTRTMGLMVDSGVSVLESLQLAKEVTSNVIVADAITEISKMVEKGFPMALSFAKHPDVFPTILPQMIAVGEETGKMSEVLGKVSHIFEIESEQKVKALTAAFEPIILIILGIGVTFIALAVIMPIYKLTTSM